LTASNEFKFVYNDESNTATQACLIVEDLSKTRTTINKSCTTSASGTIFVHVDNSSGTAYAGRGYVNTGGIQVLVDQLYKSFGDLIPETGSGILMMFLMILVFVFAMAVNLEIAVIAASLVPLMFTVMGLSKLDYTVTVPLFGLGLVVAFIIGVVRR